LNGTMLLLFWHLPITIAISSASYEFIEKPFLRRRSPYLVPARPAPAAQ
jgi:peptidoglycan/LPS O-acetylase OafA/YrhL